MFYNHPDTLFSWKETGNFCESVLSHKGSKVLNLGFNYNEEFTTKYPHMGDTPWNVSSFNYLILSIWGGNQVPQISFPALLFPGSFFRCKTNSGTRVPV